MKIRITEFNVFCAIVAIFVGLVVPAFVQVCIDCSNNIKREINISQDNLNRIADSFEYYNQRRF